VNAELAVLGAGERGAWLEALQLASTAESTRPSGKWLKAAERMIERVGRAELTSALARWFPLAGKDRSARRLADWWGDPTDVNGKLVEGNALCLRGLAWMASLAPSAEMARALGALAIASYRRVRGVGPRAVKVGNAAVYALGEMSTQGGVGQLAMLKAKVRGTSIQKEIERAFAMAAAIARLPRQDVEEMGTPSYGLTEVGSARETFDDVTATVQVIGDSVEVTWTGATGQVLKGAPAAVKKEHGDDLKELLGNVRDLEAMLPAQRDRIDGFYLAQKTWRLGEFRERYLDHPLVGTVARRLIWTIEGTAALAPDGVLRDVRGEPLTAPDTAIVALWHPVARTADEIAAWRERLEALQVTQPFKQAHREVYVVTPPERETRTYSNRFAAHILRQHQFHALCAARGWRDSLRIANGDLFPPAAKELSAFGLRVEYWVDGVGDFGVDTNETGVYRWLSTDQVRFFRAQDSTGEPMPLVEVPPLAFSEAMREVDLFVAVASVANDPVWQDSGPDGRHRAYWEGFAFGELTETARTRRLVLERLIPRLKIAAQCTLSDRFLIVAGRLRTYKIHLGSANIVMEPDGRYLCIVPARAPSKDRGSALFLPFEGDTTLSLILSKAFLLAADDRIKDPAIAAQIGGAP
jgi:hypothetical protein